MFENVRTQTEREGRGNWHSRDFAEFEPRVRLGEPSAGEIPPASFSSHSPSSSCARDRSGLIVPARSVPMQRLDRNREATLPVFQPIGSAGRCRLGSCFSVCRREFAQRATRLPIVRRTRRLQHDHRSRLNETLSRTRPSCRTPPASVQPRT